MPRDELTPGIGMVLDACDDAGDGGVQIAVVPCEDMYTRIRMTDLRNQRVVEANLLTFDIERLGRFL